MLAKYFMLRGIHDQPRFLWFPRKTPRPQHILVLKGCDLLWWKDKAKSTIEKSTYGRILGKTGTSFQSPFPAKAHGTHLIPPARSTTTHVKCCREYDSTCEMLQGVWQHMWNAAGSMTTHVKCCTEYASTCEMLQGVWQHVWDSVPRVFIRGWWHRYSLPGTCLNFRLPIGRQLFSTNLIIYANSLGATRCPC